MRQNLQIDAGLIHLADAQRAEIIEPLNVRTLAEETLKPTLEGGGMRGARPS